MKSTKTAVASSPASTNAGIKPTDFSTIEDVQAESKAIFFSFQVI